jgi:hypothetical protein
MFKLNLPGKYFMGATAAWVLHKGSKLQIRDEDIPAITNALKKSRRFNEELNKPGATAESVMNKLGLLTARGKEFERITGVPWPL